MRSNIAICTIDWCGKKCKCMGLCPKHYQAKKRRERKSDTWSEREENSFWSKVEITETCWLWVAGTDKGGYGIISINAAPFKVHRLSWLIHYGSILDQLCVLHKCDVRNCVNPDHLFLGTSTDNTLDRDTKGRQSKGETHGTAKLTEEQVREIRRMCIKGSRIYGVRPLARKYKLGKSTIQSIIDGKSWKEI